MNIKFGLLAALFLLGSACGNRAEDDVTREPTAPVAKAQDEGYVSVPGGRVWYRIVGRQSPGIPLVILHGGPGAGSRTYESLSVLSSDRPVVFYDQLGAGHSDRPDDNGLWTMERHIQELNTIRQELNLNEVHLLGHSWGAMLLIDYLATEPAGVVSAILASPVVSTSSWAADTRARLREMPEALQEAIARHEAAQTYDSPEYQEAVMAFYHQFMVRTEPWPESVNLTFEEFGTDVYSYMWGPSEFTITGTLKEWDGERSLRSISVPTLFTVGEFDETLPSTVKSFADQVEGARFEQIDESGHMTFVDAPDRSAQIVAAFLNEVEAR